MKNTSGTVPCDHATRPRNSQEVSSSGDGVQRVKHGSVQPSTFHANDAYPQKQLRAFEVSLPCCLNTPYLVRHLGNPFHRRAIILALAVFGYRKAKPIRHSHRVEGRQRSSLHGPLRCASQKGIEVRLLLYARCQHRFFFFTLWYASPHCTPIGSCHRQFACVTHL